MSHLRTFVANQVLSRIRAFLGVFCPDFYSDIEDFTQILCRYLSKISAAGTSGRELGSLPAQADSRTKLCCSSPASPSLFHSTSWPSSQPFKTFSFCRWLINFISTVLPSKMKFLLRCALSKHSLNNRCQWSAPSL